MSHRSREELDTGLDHVRAAPADDGELRLIVRRPDTDERETVERAELDENNGMVGDNWRIRSGPDGPPEVDRQITIMSSRAAEIVAGEPDAWPAAGDQLYADFDISDANAPAGTRLAIGDTVLEITEPPHTGCSKFSARFGLDALRWVNSEEGRSLNLRGIHARVIMPGTIRTGDRIKKV